MFWWSQDFLKLSQSNKFLTKFTTIEQLFKLDCVLSDLVNLMNAIKFLSMFANLQSSRNLWLRVPVDLKVLMKKLWRKNWRRRKDLCHHTCTSTWKCLIAFTWPPAWCWKFQISLRIKQPLAKKSSIKISENSLSNMTWRAFNLFHKIAETILSLLLEIFIRANGKNVSTTSVKLKSLTDCQNSNQESLKKLF